VNGDNACTKDKLQESIHNIMLLVLPAEF